MVALIELLRVANERWAVVKEAAAARCEEKGDLRLAAALRGCRMFKGDENLKELADLMFDPRAVEFMCRWGFPSISDFEDLGLYHPERFGIYINKGEVSLCGERRVLLVGNTHGFLQYGGTSHGMVCLLHGAEAVVNAGGYSVVRVEKDAKSKASYNVSGKARVLL